MSNNTIIVRKGVEGNYINNRDVFEDTTTIQKCSMNEKKSILDRFEKVILLNSRCVLGHSSIVEVEGHYYGKN